MSARGIALRGLYAITPVMHDTAELLARAERCLAGGAALLQYRYKDLPGPLAREQASALARLCRARGALFIVNDSLELAREVGAHGVHLGREDGRPEEARRSWPEGVIGVSCYASPALARDAAAAGADYVGIGSVFASGTKPQAVRAPLDTLRLAREASGLPVAAIGGVTLRNARSAIEAGADMLAVISAVFDAPDIEAAARGFTGLFAASPSGAPHVRT